MPASSVTAAPVLGRQRSLGKVNPLAMQPDREDQLEDAARDQGDEPDALCHVDHVEQVQGASRQQRRVADDAEDRDPARDQPRSVQQGGHAHSGRGGDQVDHENRHAVLGLQQRAETSRGGGLDRAVAQSGAELDHQQRNRQVEQARREFCDPEADVGHGQRLTVAFQQREQENRDSHHPELPGQQERAGGQRGGVGGGAGQEVRPAQNAGDECVGDDECASGVEEEHPDEDRGLPGGCRGRSALRHGRIDGQHGQIRCFWASAEGVRQPTIAGAS